MVHGDGRAMGPWLVVVGLVLTSGLSAANAAPGCPDGSAAPCLHEAQCYATRGGTAPGRTLSLVDRFGAADAVVRAADALCAPADRDGLDPGASDAPEHFVRYRLQGRKLPQAVELTVESALGTVSLRVRKANRLLVPAAKSLEGPPAPLAAPGGRFRCYRAHLPRQAPVARRVTVTDQFGQVTVDVRRPERLCVPVGDDDAPSDDAASLLCYAVRGPSVRVGQAHTRDALGAQVLTPRRLRELCVPARLVSGTTTSTTSVASTTTTTLGQVCGDGIVQGDEECDPPGDPTCPGSTAGAFVACRADCSCAFSTCGHDACEQGDPMPPSCAPCVDALCNFDPYCCEVYWDGICVGEVNQFCGPGTCAVCGDGVVSAGEVCDFAAPGSCGPGAQCSSDCTACSVCGDGAVQGSEQCDPPGALACAGSVAGAFVECRADCTCPAGCSHSPCDPGGPLSPACEPCIASICDIFPSCCTTAWDPLCTIGASFFCDCPSCGDGTVDPGEVCDPGLAESCEPGTSCVDCTGCAVVCGDGVVGTGEACDTEAPGSCGPNGSCRPDCSACTVCGDGTTEAPERCDPPGALVCPGDDPETSVACRADCRCPATCGHDVCTEGGPIAPSCSACAEQVCGFLPECCLDDWSSICVAIANAFCPVGTCPVCGDGVLASGEVCDPGPPALGCSAGTVCSESCTACAECPPTDGVIPPEGGVVTGSTIGGTNVVPVSCGYSLGSPERTFTWTPDRSGTAVIDTCGPRTYDPILSLRAGSCGGEEIACNDDDDGECGLGSRIVVPVVAGETYVIVVDGYDGDAGQFTLQVALES
jgi:hypothetical protein